MMGDQRQRIIPKGVEALQAEAVSPSVKQHLAAIRMLLDWLVVGEVMPSNPVSAVRGPKQWSGAAMLSEYDVVL